MYLQFDPPIIAHRGASGYAPENTIVAFDKAKQLGINWVEFDVMLASCKTPFIFHDETLDRTTNLTGEIAPYDYSSLSKLDAGSWFNSIYKDVRIPAFKETMDWLCRVGMSANIEIKPLQGQDMETAEVIWQSAKDYIKPHHPTFLFSSFSIDSLRTLRTMTPDALIGLLIHDWMPDWKKICDDLSCVSVHLFDEIVTLDRATAIKSTGRKLLCYTVNDPDRAKELYSWGVDAVFSDFPDKILSSLS